MPIRLLDYGRSNPFGEIVGKTRYLAWPVNVYRVTLPKVTEDADVLNPFERVILKILDAEGARDTEALAQEVCIPVDLVQCVLLRLQDKAFVDKHNEIIKQTRGNWIEKDKREPDSVTALCFKELASGKYLPYLHLLDGNNPLKTKEGGGKIIQDKHAGGPPTPRDVISALRAMKKRSKVFGGEAHMPAVKQISIAKTPERYYLDCPIAIQKSDGEFRIADPFGMGFSLVLENGFSRLLETDESLSEWFMDWKKSLSGPRQDRPNDTQQEPYDTEMNRGRYPKLVFNLRLKEGAQHRSIWRIHAALEWALFYACAERPYDTAVSQLRLTNHSSHSTILNGVAEKVGMIPPKGGVRPVSSKKLDDFLSGETEMGTVLGIALLTAESDMTHPLRRIAVQYPNFITRIYEIKKMRDAYGHGQGRVSNIESELPEETFMRDVVALLLPSMRFSGTPGAADDKDYVSDMQLDARTGIQKEFSFSLFNSKRVAGDLLT